MANPLSIGSIFTYKGYRCTVTAISSHGFKYCTEDDSVVWNCYMSWAFYKTTPSYLGRQPMRTYLVYKKEYVSSRRLKEIKKDPNYIIP